MAATRLIALHVNKGKTVAQCLADRTDYSQNASKTNDGEFISSYECDPKTADEEFLLAKRQYQHITGRQQKNNIIAYQIRQSFKPGEITPEEANQVGYETAMRWTKGNHAFIVATHIDKAHIHNHIIYNSTSVDCSRKFNNFFLSGLAVQKLSDRVCAEHGLSIITPKPYRERQKRTVFPKKRTKRDELCEAIDSVLKEKPKSFEDFVQALADMGFEYKDGKQPAFRGKGQKRFIRLRSLGEGYYHPVVVSLSETELEEYLDITAKIRKNVHADKNGKVILSEYAKTLLIKRARLVSGAVEKIDVLRDLMQNYKDDNHMLVYCGATTMHDVDYKEGKAHIEDIRQIDLVADMLGNDFGMRVSKFTSEEDAAERERIKADFDAGDHLQAVVAIRCLDEGVNIPSIKTAFIMASSTNPKEYVQRRGRVLRLFKGKKFAVIYDFITLPFALDCMDQIDAETLESGKSLAKREILRMKDFASIAENPFDSDELISQIQSAYEIEIDDENQEDDDYV